MGQPCKWKPVQRCLFFAVILIGMLAIVGSNGGGGSNSDGSGSGGDPAQDNATELPPAVTAEIKADEGGTITLENGAALTIPADALPEDKSITVSPVQVESLGDKFVVGLQFEPDGLVLNEAATCDYPLPDDWDGEEAPLIYASNGNELSNFYNTGVYATVSGEKGNYMAQTRIYHFSAEVLVKNCHAGTLQYLLESFYKRGCSRTQAFDAVCNYKDENDDKPFEDYSPPELGENEKSIRVNEKWIQAFLATYFKKIYSYDKGEELPSLGKLLEYARDEENGRQVVFSFSKGQWQQKSNGLYKNFKHTAALEKVDGQVKLRNSVEATDAIEQALIEKNGENAYWYPEEGELTAESLQKFRESLPIEALENELCGSIGCLSDKSKNSYGISFAHPPDQREDVTRPWTAMNVYVEKVRLSENPCQDNGTADEIFAIASIASDVYPILASGDKCDACLADLTHGGEDVELANIPYVIGYTGNAYNVREQIHIALHPALSGTGTYTSVGDPLDLDEGVDIGIIFSTSAIIDKDKYGMPVAFHSTSGTVEITRFGTQIGDRVSGTFDVAIEGEQDLCSGNDCDEKTIAGTLSGDFDTLLVPQDQCLPSMQKAVSK